MDIAFVDFTATGRFEIVSSSNLDVVAPLRDQPRLEAYGLMRSGGTLMDQTTGFRTEINTTGLATERFDLERDLQEIAKVPQLTLGGLRTVTEASERFPRARGSLDPRRRGSSPSGSPALSLSRGFCRQCCFRSRRTIRRRWRRRFSSSSW